MLNFKVWLYFSHSSLITVSRRKSLKRENKSSIAISKPSNKREVKKKKKTFVITKGKIFNEPVMGDTISWPCQNSPKQWFSNFIVGYIKKKKFKNHCLAKLNVFIQHMYICRYLLAYAKWPSIHVHNKSLTILFESDIFYSIQYFLFYFTLLHSLLFYFISLKTNSDDKPLNCFHNPPLTHNWT